jgi:hypothetical protein
MAEFVLEGSEELQEMAHSLLSTGRRGRAIFRKGLRAGAKVVADHLRAIYPRRTGKAVASIKVRALKRKRGRIGFMVVLFAQTPEGQPYTMFLEGGVKVQPRGVRVRKASKKITVGGRGVRVTDEERSVSYHALKWRIEPQHYQRRAFKESAAEAERTILATCVRELEKQAAVTAK